MRNGIQWPYISLYTLWFMRKIVMFWLPVGHYPRGSKRPHSNKKHLDVPSNVILGRGYRGPMGPMTHSQLHLFWEDPCPARCTDRGVSQHGHPTVQDGAFSGHNHRQ